MDAGKIDAVIAGMCMNGADTVSKLSLEEQKIVLAAVIARMPKEPDGVEDAT
jgi:hypothetical protein